jgi:retinol-binding protein 3
MRAQLLQAAMRCSQARSARAARSSRRAAWLLVFLGGTATTLAQSPSGNASAGHAGARAAVSLDAVARKEVVESLAQKLADSYAVAEPGQKAAEAIRAKLASGAYDKITAPEDFAGVLHADVRAVADDRHLRVSFDTGPAPLAGPMPAPGTQGKPGAPPPGMPDIRKMNGAIGRVQILPGNVGYIEASGVPPGAKAAIDAAFAFLKNTDALIIDLRGNGGGLPQTVAHYMSYLSEGEPYAVMRVYARNGSFAETRTTDLGERSYGSKKPVYVLTSYLTFSGGEEFAYDVQAFKRGLIVGETTGGGANPGGPQPLGRGFTVFLPTGLGKHPVTGTSWEGVGVKPDVPVAAGLALLEAHRLAVERLQAGATDVQESALLQVIAANLAAEKKAATSIAPRPLTKAQLQLVGVYAPVGGEGPGFAVLEKEGVLVLQPRSTRPPSRLVQVLGDTYRLDGLPEDFTASFSSTAEGKGRLLLQQSNSRPPLVLEKR